MKSLICASAPQRSASTAVELNASDMLGHVDRLGALIVGTRAHKNEKADNASIHP
jgi:hypothetical protein